METVTAPATDKTRFRRAAVLPAADNDAAAFSFVVPVLNEAATIAAFLASLRACYKEPCEIIVVDGSSDDRTAELARPGSDLVIVSRGGRAIQMNAGARPASGAIVCFVHADSMLPRHADQTIRHVLSAEQRQWGALRRAPVRPAPPASRC